MMKLIIVASLASCAVAFTSPAKPAFKTELNMAKYRSKLGYVDALSLADLPSPGSATSCVAGGLAICIAVDKSGKIFALGDKCPPVNQPLSFGQVNDDGTIQDPVLGTKFSLKTGDVVDWCPAGIGKLIGGVFDPVGVPIYSTKKGKGCIQVQVDLNAKLNYEANYWSGVLDAQGKDNGKYY